MIATAARNDLRHDLLGCALGRNSAMGACQGHRIFNDKFRSLFLDCFDLKKHLRQESRAVFQLAETFRPGQVLLHCFDLMLVPSGSCFKELLIGSSAGEFCLSEKFDGALLLLWESKSFCLALLAHPTLRLLLLNLGWRSLSFWCFFDLFDISEWA